MGRHNLDHASTSPLRPVALEAMRDALEEAFGDPSRIHADGLAGRFALETARETIASSLGARPREVLFTSGATESIAAVCWGAAPRGTHQVLAAVEHSAVRENAAAHGEVRLAGVDAFGCVSPDELMSLVDDDTAVVHLQAANHEVGTLQPVDDVVRSCRERGVLVHVDAAQSVGRMPFDFAGLGADLVSVSGHKLGGPMGIGVLLVRRGVRLRPLLLGGDQERARRAGMENVIGAVGLAAAISSIDPEAEAATQRKLVDRIRIVLSEVDGVTLLGADPSASAPHLVCAAIADVEPQAVLLGLDRAGVSAHSGSACASEGLEPSPVLEAMGVDAHRSLRLSLGWSSTPADVEAFTIAFPAVVTELRALRS